MAASFACPSCQAVLKTKTEIPAGKKVKCPKCATIFVAADEPARPAGIAVRSPGPAAPTRKPPAAAARPAPMRSGPPPAAASTRRKPAVEEEDDDGDRDDEDRPTRKRRRKGRKNQGNPVLLWSLIGGGAAFLIGGVLFAGLVWPGFLLAEPKTKVRIDPFAPAPVLPQANAGLPKGTGNEDLLNFVPPGCTMFVGLDRAILRDRPDLAKEWQDKADLFIQMIPRAPRGLREIIGQTDRALLASTADEKNAPGGSLTQYAVLVVRTRSPYDPDQIRQIVHAFNKEQLKDKTYYRMDPFPGLDQHGLILHMPNDRVLVFAVAAPQRLANVLGFTGVAPAVGSQAIAEIRAVENLTFWLATETNPDLRDKLAMLDGIQAGMPPEVKAAVGPLQKMKGASLSLDTGKGPKWKVTVSATCASAADAQQLTTALQAFWQKQGKQSLGAVKLFIPPNAPASLGQLLDEISNTFTVTNTGDKGVVSIEVMESTFQQLLANAGQFQMMGPGMNPPPVQPPPVIRPPVVPKRRPIRP